MQKNKEYIKRIKSLDIKNFRGIKMLDKPLNLDADIVLLNGPNGFGKTSVIDALCLLLTGFHYPERQPLLFNGEDEGYIKAEVEYIYEGQCKVEERNIKLLRIGKSENVSIRQGNTEMQSNQQSAKASFYYFDLIKYLFDVEGGDIVTLRDILAPVPAGIENVKSVLKENIKMIKNKNEEYQACLEEEVKERLKMYKKDLQESYIKFRDIWNCAAKLAQEYEFNLPVFDISADVNQFDPISTVEEGLASIINKCNSMEGLPNIPYGENKAQVLPLFETYLERLKEHFIKALEYKQQLKLYIESLSDDDYVPDREMVRQKEEELGQAERQKKELEDTQIKLQKLEKHYQAEDEEHYGLLEILEIISKNCKRWSELPDFINPSDRPPEVVVRWLQNLNNNFYVNGVGIDEHFLNWYNEIKEKRINVAERLAEKDKQCQLLRNTISQWKNIIDLIDKSQETLTFLSGLKWGQGGKVPKVQFLRWYHQFQSNYDSIGEKLISEMNKLQDEFKNLKNILNKLGEQQNRLRQSSRYQKAIKQLEMLEEILTRETSGEDSILENVISLPNSYREKYEEFVNKVFKRFRLVEGLYPISLRDVKQGKGKNAKNVWDFKTQDNRTFRMLSTGQKAQLALSFLLGLNMAIGKELNHGIIALDDTSAAFDMAQLAREAILLRQIAYGTEISADENSAYFGTRQLFIVSHHEDLTHRLLDFLTPPEGKKMHILNFVDWDHEKGPTIEQYRLESGMSATSSSIKEFGQLLDSVVRSIG